MQCIICQTPFEGTDNICPNCRQRLAAAPHGELLRREPIVAPPATVLAPKHEARGREVWRCDATQECGLSFPLSVAVRGDRVLVLDQPDDYRILEFDVAGRFQGVWLEMATGDKPGCLDDPHGICIDPQGRVLVPDAGNDRISIWRSDRSFDRVLGRPGAKPGQLARPGDVDVDDEGYVYVADTFNRRVQVFSPDGFVALEIGDAGAWGKLQEPVAVTADSQKNVYVIDKDRNVLLKFSPDGALTASWPNSPDAEPLFDEPGDVRLGAEGSLIVSDRRNLRVQRLAPNGALLGLIDLTGDDDVDHEGGDIAAFGNNVLIPDRWHDCVVCVEFQAPG